MLSMVLLFETLHDLYHWLEEIKLIPNADWTSDVLDFLRPFISYDHGLILLKNSRTDGALFRSTLRPSKNS